MNTQTRENQRVKTHAIQYHTTKIETCSTAVLIFCCVLVAAFPFCSECCIFHKPRAFGESSSESESESDSSSSSSSSDDDRRSGAAPSRQLADKHKKKKHKHCQHHQHDQHTTHAKQPKQTNQQNNQPDNDNNGDSIGASNR